MRQNPTIDISLSHEVYELVAVDVASGRFSTASEVVRAGLRLLEKQNKRSAGKATGGLAQHAG